jgi:hypothetical protein
MLTLINDLKKREEIKSSANLKNVKDLPTTILSPHISPPRRDVAVTEWKRLTAVQGISRKGKAMVTELSNSCGYLSGQVLLLTEPEAEGVFYALDMVGMTLDINLGKRTSYGPVGCH